MTLSSQTSKNVFVGDGATVLFTYTFRIFADADLEVTIQDTSVTPQTEITLVLTSDYTVTGAGDAGGGTITLLLTGQLSAAPSATDNITIKRNLPLTQPTDYVENDPFPSTAHEDALDRSRMIDQQLDEEVSRSVRLAINITGVSVILPTPLADAPIGWNSAADALVNNPSQTNLSQIDSAATPDFIGNSSSTGVLRTGSNLTYIDGGNFVTLDLAASPSITSITLATSLILNGFTVTDILDDDTMSADSATALVTQQSLVAFVAAQVATANEFVELTDTPANFTGDGLKMVRVNTGETALEFFLISDAAAATVASGDLVLVSDVDDSNILKRVTAQSIGDLGAGGVDITVQDEGSPLTTAVTLFNFAGAGVTVTEPVADQVLVTISGAGGVNTLIEDTDQNTKIQTEESADENILRFDTAGNQVMFIDASGKVGIGILTADLDGDFHQAVSAESNSVIFDTYSINNAQQSSVVLRKSASATIGTASETADIENLGTLEFRGVNNVSAFTVGARITSTQRGTATAFIPSELSFVTSNDTSVSEKMNISPDGEITKPFQPAFLVTPSVAQNNLALATDHDVAFATEIFDIGANFATPNFTAPVTGKYLLSFNIRLDQMDSAATTYAISLVTSNRTYFHIIDAPNLFTADLTNSNWTLSVTADMDASDTAKCVVRQDGGTAQTDIREGIPQTFFSGHLVA